MEEMFKHILCLFSDFPQPVADFLKGGAGSVENFTFCIDRLKDFFFKSF